jgi:hypothetical protein
MEDIPREMLDEILSWLDKPSLFQASNTCKLWRQQALTYTAAVNNMLELRDAAENGDRLSIVKCGYNEWITKCFDVVLHGACRGGHKDLVQLMINKGAGDLIGGFYYACEGGHREIIKLLIVNGVTSFDDGLYGACRGGQRDIAELMMIKGANNFEGGLFSACLGRHKDLMKLMINRGASSCFCGESVDEH